MLFRGCLVQMLNSHSSAVEDKDCTVDNRTLVLTSKHLAHSEAKSDFVNWIDSRVLKIHSTCCNWSIHVQIRCTCSNYLAKHVHSAFEEFLAGLVSGFHKERSDHLDIHALSAFEGFLAGLVSGFY